MSDLFANFWEEILSRQTKRIRACYLGLETEEREAVLAHLQRMTSEPDWHPAQEESAQIALQAIRELDQPPGEN